MVVLKKINETKIDVTYEYYPEDRQHLKPGVIEIDKTTYDFKILKFAEQDCNTKTYSVYAYMGVGKIINDYLKKIKVLQMKQCVLGTKCTKNINVLTKILLNDTI